MRLRARFTKLGKVRFTSHRDVARMWERALRRASLPVAYTEGFSPRPKLHFGLALGTGHESLGEYLDIDLRPDLRADLGPDLGVDVDGADAVDVDGAAAEAAAEVLDLERDALRLSEALPEGIDVTALAVVDRSADSLQQAVTSCSWRIGVEGASAGQLADAVARALAAPNIPVTRQRKGKAVNDDLRPLLLSLHTEAPSTTHADGGPLLLAELATQPRAVRPAELLAALDETLVERSVCRLQQWITHDGVRCEPLVGAADVSRARTLVLGR